MRQILVAHRPVVVGEQERKQPTDGVITAGHDLLVVEVGAARGKEQRPVAEVEGKKRNSLRRPGGSGRSSFHARHCDI